VTTEQREEADDMYASDQEAAVSSDKPSAPHAEHGEAVMEGGHAGKETGKADAGVGGQKASPRGSVVGAPGVAEKGTAVSA
jgi:hypothetical protein